MQLEGQRSIVNVNTDVQQKKKHGDGMDAVTHASRITSVVKIGIRDLTYFLFFFP